ncbi:MAG TPA: GNAT family N-acetyltransferase [Actinotalea sp.]
MTAPRPMLRTPRLLLRPFSPADGDALHAYLGDPEVVRYEPYEPYSRGASRAEAARRADDPDFWAVVLDGPEATLVGNLWLHPTSSEAHTWQLGYVFGRQWWRQGLATEACRAGLEHVVAGGAHRVEARCDPRNTASWRLLERLGLRREAHLHQAASFRRDGNGDPVWHDTYIYAVLAEEWRG